MSDNKKYYYLKLKDDFFNSDSMVILESMQDGYIYSNILLKLYLKSLKDDGRLMLNGRIPYNSSTLAMVTRHSVGDVERAIKAFEELGIVEILDNGAMYMTDIQNFIGQSSTEADRKRAYRNRIESEKVKQLGSQDSNAQKSIGQMSDKCPDKSPPEIERELELELEKEDIYSRAIPDIVSYLNEKVEANYKPTTAKTKTLIKARIDEGFSLDDFKKVIDKKTREWKGTDMEKYLRPETLFGTKFEGYLNQKEKGESTGYEPDYEHGIVL